MKCFDDLEFRQHPGGAGGIQAIMYFPNGFGVSVVKGPWFYSSKSEPYELAVLHKDGSITYDTPITNDVLGYCTRDDITDIMKQVQELAKETT